MADLKHILLTGAGGFIGRRLTAALLADARFGTATLTLLDKTLPADLPHERVLAVQGDFADPAILARCLDPAPDLVFHLAGILGGAAEAEYDLARLINIDATIALFEALRNAARPPRVVFASSIAVFGPDMPAVIDDDTWPLPRMSYGAQKLMMETLLQQFSDRGWLDGLAIRLPGIVARRGADARLKSAFLNQIFFAVAEGRDFTMPVDETGTSWMLSVPACVAAFIHAGLLETSRIGARRCFTLPAQVVRMDGLVAALQRRFPQSASRIAWAKDASLQAQFAAQPALRTDIADALGFRHDGSLEALIDAALQH